MVFVNFHEFLASSVHHLWPASPSSFSPCSRCHGKHGNCITASFRSFSTMFPSNFPIIFPPFSPHFCWRNPEIFPGAHGHHDAMNQWLDHGENQWFFMVGKKWSVTYVCVFLCGVVLSMLENGCKIIKIYGSIIFQSLYIYNYNYI